MKPRPKAMLHVEAEREEAIQKLLLLGKTRRDAELQIGIALLFGSWLKIGNEWVRVKA